MVGFAGMRDGGLGVPKTLIVVYMMPPDPSHRIRGAGGMLPPGRSRAAPWPPEALAQAASGGRAGGLTSQPRNKVELEILAVEAHQVGIVGKAERIDRAGPDALAAQAAQGKVQNELSRRLDALLRGRCHRYGSAARLVLLGRYRAQDGEATRRTSLGAGAAGHATRHGRVVVLARKFHMK